MSAAGGEAGPTEGSERPTQGLERPVVPVAVLVTSYKRKPFLEKALAAVQAQTVQPAEVIVVDDCSGDGSAALARDMGAHVIAKTVNEGVRAARTDAMAAAEGFEWVALLDDDDIWLPHHLKTVWEARDGHVLVSSATLSFGAGPPIFHGTVLGHPEVVRSPRRLMFPDNSVGTSTTLLRRDVALEAGGYDLDVPSMEDLDLWLRVLELGTGLLLPEVTCLYRMHPAQETRLTSLMASGPPTLAAKYADRAWISPELVESWQVVTTWDDFQAARRAGRWSEAWPKARWLLSSPRRPVALSKLWAFRRQGRQQPRPAALLARVAAETTEARGPSQGLGS